MDEIMNKVGSYWLGKRADKEINSVGDDFSSLSTSIEGGAKWLVNKLKVPTNEFTWDFGIRPSFLLVKFAVEILELHKLTNMIGMKAAWWWHSIIKDEPHLERLQSPTQRSCAKSVTCGAKALRNLVLQ
ncbi:hypothetical protein IFM89_010280 [Coptis chinensis]|uniref:Uncharacterized protein n=1 Tax=Coptis chinensis TaxID=261450 RepID=A0A835LGS8_9MAGN|nr:hypothetical protein IFM89_010280 [Coptis chinensis]